MSGKFKLKKHISLDIEICITHDISYAEWILLSQIEFLSARHGYCFANRSTLSEALKMTERGLRKMINRLEEKDLLEVDKNNHLRVTEKWLEMQSTKGEKAEQSSGGKRNKVPVKEELSSGHVEELSSAPTYKEGDFIEGREEGSVTTEVLTTSQVSSKIIAEHLLKKIIENKPNFKKPNLSTWESEIEKAIRIDGRTANELIGCIDWIYSDNRGAFWIPNILSGKKLREKFDTMEAQMINDPKQKSLNAISRVLEAKGYAC